VAAALRTPLAAALAPGGPGAIRHRGGGVPPPPDPPAEPIPVGRWEEVRRGGDVAIMAIGRMVEVATVAADLLAAEGIACGVVNARWLKPVDPRLVSDWAIRYRVLLTAEDNVGIGGLRAAGLEALAPHGLAGKVRMAALPDRFLPHGRQAEILAEHGLDPDGLVLKVKAALVETAQTA